MWEILFHVYIIRLFQFLFHEIVITKISWNWINVFLKYCDPKSHLTALNKMAVRVLYWYRRKNWINFRGWLRIHVFTEITVEASLETIHLKWGIFKKLPSHFKKKFSEKRPCRCSFVAAILRSRNNLEIIILLSLFY